MTAIHAAMRGLATRQRAIANNVANIETPGYLAKTVDFESSLAAAIRGGDPGSFSISTGTSLEATTPNGNNVKLDDETVASLETNLRYSLAVEAMNAKFRGLRTAIGG
jgi:flagellar basal-body rod protein FlgB